MTSEGDITFANEQNYKAAQRAYILLNAADHLRIKYRPGDHHGFDDIGTYMDWFDAAFDAARTFDFPEQLLHNFNWTQWQATTPVPPPPTPTAPLEDRVNWLLGQTVPQCFSGGASE